MIRSLKIYCDLVQTRHFTETARRNYLTQSGVSRHLRALEASLGRRLVERSRPLRLTRAGEQVYELGQEVLRAYAKMERALQEPPKEVSGHLALSAIHAVGLYDLPPYIATYLKRYPKVNLLLSYLKPPEIYEGVLQGRLDLGLVDYPRPHPKLEIRLWTNEQLVLITPATHSLAGRKQITLKQLDGQPMIAFQPGLPMRKAVDDALREARVNVHVVNAFDNVEIIKGAVEVGLGLAIVPRVSVEHEVRDETLKSLGLKDSSLVRPIGIVTHKERELSLPAQKFIDTLLSRGDRAVERALRTSR